MPLMNGYLPLVGGKYPLVQCKNSANSFIHQTGGKITPNFLQCTEWRQNLTIVGQQQEEIVSISLYN